MTFGAFKCARCGRELTPFSKGVRSVTILAAAPVKNFDLCSKCYEEFMELVDGFLKGGEKEGKCAICGKPIGDAAPGIRCYATLVLRDEYLGLSECGKAKMCAECWHRLTGRPREAEER